jgi:hypothetical protein
MTHHDKALELVELLLAYDARTATGRLTHRAADTITALSERNRVLEEAVEAVIQFHNSTFSGPCAAQNKGRQWKGVLRKCLNARAALTSGGRG